MNIEEKFKEIAAHFRLVSGSEWNEIANFEFIKKLNSYDKKLYPEFIEKLLKLGYIQDQDRQLVITDAGEIYIYGNETDPTLKILRKLFDMGFTEGYCWQFASYHSFKESLNAAESKRFFEVIERLINDGILVSDNDGMLILTKKGEEKLFELFYK